jgi:hypothetical protein
MKNRAHEAALTPQIPPKSPARAADSPMLACFLFPESGKKRLFG